MAGLVPVIAVITLFVFWSVENGHWKVFIARPLSAKLTHLNEYTSVKKKKKKMFSSFPLIHCCSVNIDCVISLIQSHITICCTYVTIYAVCIRDITDKQHL